MDVVGHMRWNRSIELDGADGLAYDWGHSPRYTDGLRWR